MGHELRLTQSHVQRQELHYRCTTCKRELGGEDSHLMLRDQIKIYGENRSDPYRVCLGCGKPATRQIIWKDWYRQCINERVRQLQEITNQRTQNGGKEEFMENEEYVFRCLHCRSGRKAIWHLRYRLSFGRPIEVGSGSRHNDFCCQECLQSVQEQKRKEFEDMAAEMGYRRQWKYDEHVSLEVVPRKR